LQILLFGKKFKNSNVNIGWDIGIQYIEIRDIGIQDIGIQDSGKRISGNWSREIRIRGIDFGKRYIQENSIREMVRQWQLANHKWPLYNKNSDLFIYYKNGIFSGLCTGVVAKIITHTATPPNFSGSIYVAWFFSGCDV
jgi:hypothetical protein